MGSLWTKLFAKKDVRVVMTGLDAGGKTTTLYQWKLGECLRTIPTMGFNIETVVYEKVTFTFWDIGIGDKGRPLLRHYYTPDTEAVILVIDSCDRERLDELLSDFLTPLLDNCLVERAHLLFLANKQDLPNAMTVEEITERLGLQQLLSLRKSKWAVLPTSAKTGEGIWEALQWLGESIGHLQPRKTDTTLQEVKVQIDGIPEEVIAHNKVDLNKRTEDNNLDVPGTLSWALHRTANFLCGGRKRKYIE